MNNTATSQVISLFQRSAQHLSRNGLNNETEQAIGNILAASPEAWAAWKRINEAATLREKMGLFHSNHFYRSEQWQKDIFFLLASGIPNEQIAETLKATIPLNAGRPSGLAAVIEAEHLVTIHCGCASEKVRPTLTSMFESYYSPGQRTEYATRLGMAPPAPQNLPGSIVPLAPQPAG